MTTLVLARHAKSAYPNGVPDHDRPLNERGERESQVMAQRLGERFANPDLVLVSTAHRAQQTWGPLRQMWPGATHLDRSDLYLADSDELLSQVTSLPLTADVVVMIGHNAGMEDLATELSGVPVTMKTSTFAVLTSDQAWARWASSTAELTEVVVAR